MKKFLYIPIFLGLLVLAACETPDRIKIIQGIDLLNRGGELTAEGMLVAAEAGTVSKRDVCEFEMASRVANEISDQALITAIRNDLETAQGQLEAAQGAMRGVGDEVVALVAANC